MTKDWQYQDNGFSSFQEMEDLHRPIINCVSEVVGQLQGKIIDFGCGNGQLLKSIYEKKLLIPYGVDTNPNASNHR